jgi:hypothetical protein
MQSFNLKMKAISFTNWSDDIEASITANVEQTTHVTEFKNTHELRGKKRADV